MSSTVHPSLFKDIKFDVNIECRKASIMIPDVLESTARPIRNPRTGAEHRVRINLPDGIEFDLAEFGSGTSKMMASIALDLKDTYFHFTVFPPVGQLSGPLIIESNRVQTGVFLCTRIVENIHCTPSL